VSYSLVEKEIHVFDYELEEFISRMKRQVLKVLLPFISFMHGFKKKHHNMLAFILEPMHNNMRLVITYLGHEALTILMANYDELLLLPLLLEAYKGLLPNKGDYLDEFASFVDSQDLFQ